MIYAFLTWLVANLLNPLFMMLWLGFGDGNISIAEIAGIYPMLLVFCLLFSIPSLVICCMAVYIPTLLPLNLNFKYLLWILIAISIPFLNLLFLKLIEADFFNEFGYDFALPASGAALLSILLRYNAFMKFLSQPSETTNE
jgi:hypothetical protein